MAKRKTVNRDNTAPLLIPAKDDPTTCPVCGTEDRHLRDHLWKAHYPKAGCAHCGPIQPGSEMRLDFDLIKNPLPNWGWGYWYHHAGCGRYTA
jgi:hypothetical protein